MKTTSLFSGKLIVITGPTASGKTGVAIRLAQLLNAPIISADSRQFYKEIPIGTAAPTKDELKMATHYMIGNLSVQDEYNVYKFEIDVLELLNTTLINEKIVILTGGSGLYIDAVCKGIDILPDIDKEIRERIVNMYKADGIESLRLILKDLDPEYYNQVDTNNHKRLSRAIEVCLQTGQKYSELRKNKPRDRSFKIVKIGIEVPRELLVDRINKRVELMISQGWIDEAKQVFEHRNLNSLNTVGYKELFTHFDGNYTIEEAIEKIKTNTRRYAKRQMTWFRRDKELHWCKPDDIKGMMAIIE